MHSYFPFSYSSDKCNSFLYHKLHLDDIYYRCNSNSFIKPSFKAQSFCNVLYEIVTYPPMMKCSQLICCHIAQSIDNLPSMLRLPRSAIYNKKLVNIQLDKLLMVQACACEIK